RQVSQALTATTVGPTALLRGVAQALIGVSGAVSCLITLTQSGNPAEQAVEVRDGVQPGVPEDKLVRVPPGLITQVVIEQRPVFSEDIQLDGRFPLDPLAQQYGWLAPLRLPLLLAPHLVRTGPVYFHDVRGYV